MPRPERFLDPNAGPVEAFAAGLRELRERAGRPTYASLARRAHRSASSLAEAAGGSQFPTLDTTLAYVRACGGDEAEWRVRWAETSQALQSQTPDAIQSQDGQAKRSIWRRPRRLIVVSGVVLAAVAVAAITLTLRPQRPVSEHDSAGTQVPDPAGMLSPTIHDGADPADTGCAADPNVATVQSHEVDVAGVPVGLIELRYAPRCGVSWGRFTPAPQGPAITKPGPVVVHVLVIREADHHSEPFSARYTGLPVFGNVLNSTRFCVHAEAYFSGPGWQEQPGKTGCYRGATAIHP